MEYIDLEAKMTAMVARVAFDRVIEGLLKLFPPDIDLKTVKLPKEWPIPLTQMSEIFPELKNAEVEKAEVYHTIAKDRWREMVASCQAYELRDPNELFAPMPKPWSQLMQTLVGIPFEGNEAEAKTQVENFTSQEFFQYNLSNHGVERHNNAVTELVSQVVSAQISPQEKQYLLDRVSQHNNTVLTKGRIHN
jgi:hypothetical protein